MSKKTKSSSGRLITKQIFYLFATLFVLVAISVLATLIATRVIDLSPQGTGPVHNIADAEAICNQRIRNDHGDNVHVIAPDNLSTRFDDSVGEFKVFSEVDMFRDASKRTGTQLYYVTCKVASEDGSISRMEYHEAKDFKPKPGRRETGNAFGM